MDTYRIEPDPAHWGENIVQGILKDPGELSQGTYIWFTPDEFIEMASFSRAWRPDIRRLDSLRKSLIDEGKQLENALILTFRGVEHPDHDGQSTYLPMAWQIEIYAGRRIKESDVVVVSSEHDGRHRATILKEMGHETIPVKVKLTGNVHPLSLHQRTRTVGAALDRLSFMKIEDAVKDPFFPKYVVSESFKYLYPFTVRHRRIREVGE